MATEGIRLIWSVAQSWSVAVVCLVSKISAAASKILQKGWRKITVSILQGATKTRLARRSLAYHSRKAAREKTESINT